MSRLDVGFRAVVLALLVGILGTGLALFVHRESWPGGPVEIILPPPAPTSRNAMVYVTGAVLREGVYSLGTSDRVADAIAAAGGLTPDADRQQVNLAVRVMDGQHVHVPSLIAAAPPATASPGGRTPVNINTATKAELEALPSIGPVLAQAVVDYRDRNGAFGRIEDFIVHGDGEKSWIEVLSQSV